MNKKLETARSDNQFQNNQAIGLGRGMGQKEETSKERSSDF